MAWYIDYTTLTNKFLETSSAIELSGNFTIKFEAKYPAPSFRFMGSGANNSRIELDTTARIRVTNSASTSVTLTFSGIDVTEFNEYEITRAGSTLALSINGVSQSTITLSGTLNFNRFFRNQLSGVSANCSVKYCEITIAGTLTHEYRNTTGTGTSWVDQISGNNAAQSGTWPANDDEWVFYDDGGATTSTISYDLGAFGFAVESTVTAPAVTASAVYDIGALGFAVSANAIAPTVTASLSYDLGAFGFAASATASVPIMQSAIDYSIGDFGFAVIADATSENNTASISYDLGAFGFAVDAVSTVPVVSADAAYDLGAFGFSVAADIATAPTASILYDLGGFGFAASAQVIPPPVQASTVYDLGSFDFSVFATQPTGLRPQAGATLRFNELSRKVAAIELSRSVRYTELSRKVRG